METNRNIAQLPRAPIVTVAPQPNKVIIPLPIIPPLTNGLPKKNLLNIITGKITPVAPTVTVPQIPLPQVFLPQTAIPIPKTVVPITKVNVAPKIAVASPPIAIPPPMVNNENNAALNRNTNIRPVVFPEIKINNTLGAELDQIALMDLNYVQIRTEMLKNTQVPIPVPMPLRLIKEIQLRPWQVAWAERARNILFTDIGYIDTSRMGRGKTYVLLWLAKQLHFRILVICPKIMKTIWNDLAKEYGVEVIDTITYQSLRSQTGHQPKHGYLDRFDNFTDGGVHQVSFAPTKKYLDLIEKGIMVVCDEIQNIKTNSDQYKACNALMRPILTGGLSRFALLSGTPFDKEEHAVNLLKLIGYIRAHRLYYCNETTKELVLEGIQELIDSCMIIDRDMTRKVLSEIPLVKGKMNHLCYTLYVRVIKAHISGAIDAPPETEMIGRFDVKNGFYNISDTKAEDLRNAVNELRNATRYNERTGTVDITDKNIGAVTTALVHVENAKIHDFARVATSILMDNNYNKVIICLNYTTTIKEIANLLIFYNPLILNGSITSEAKRKAIIDAFNTDTRFRVLIMNTAVGGVGISLHDTTGNSPRFMLMSPSYKLLEVTQAAGRVYRDKTLSDATVRMFYGKETGSRETMILNAMARKTEVLKGTLEDRTVQDLILPGDYPEELEL